MSEISKPAQWIVWGGLGILIAILAAAYVRTELFKPPANVVSTPFGIASSNDDKELPILSALSEFSFTNQSGLTVTRETLAGTPWVADIIFTRCPSICPQMTFQMSRLQEALGPDSPVKLVSFTTDPEFDTSEVLKAYGERFGATPDRWHFLTGPKQDLSDFIKEDLKLIAFEKPEDERTSPTDLYNHSVHFAIVDGDGNLRRVVHANDTNINVIDEIVATVNEFVKTD